MWNKLQKNTILFGDKTKLLSDQPNIMYIKKKLSPLNSFQSFSWKWLFGDHLLLAAGERTRINFKHFITKWNNSKALFGSNNASSNNLRNYKIHNFKSHLLRPAPHSGPVGGIVAAPLLLIGGHAGPNVRAVAFVVFAPGAADVGGGGVAPRRLLLGLRRRLAAVAEVGLPQFGAVVHRRLPGQVAGTVDFVGWFRAARDVPVGVLVHVLLRGERENR